MSKIIIIDGNSLLFRAYYATYNPDETKLMRNSKGQVTNAIFAFSNMMANILSSLKENDGIFVAFDKGKHTFRHKEYAEYKANRPPCPTDLLSQMPIAREFLDSLNIKYFELDELEADDLAGIVAKNAENDGYKVEIYTSDKDYLQLIDENITINLIKKGLKDIHVMTPSSFVEEWGINPIQITDYKGLVGDSSDNLKGIPGIGDKRAKTLISEFGSLENIIENIDSIKGKFALSIKENKDLGLMCKNLAIIRTDYEIPLKTEELIYSGFDFSKITEFINKYELKTLINKLPKSLRQTSIKDIKVTFEEVNDLDFEIPTQIGVGLDISNDNYHDCTFFGLTFAINNKNYYVSKDNILKSQRILDILKNENIKKYVFNFKKLYVVLKQNGIEINGLVFDLLLSNYLIDSSIKDNLESVLTYNSINIQYAYENMTLFSESNPLLSAIEAYYSINLAPKIIKELKDKEQYDLLINIEQPLSIVLGDMEIEGFPLSKDTLLEFKKEYAVKIENVSKRIYEIAGEEFNLSSPKQIANILFNKLGIEKNKKGLTSSDVLEEIKKTLTEPEKIELIDLILEYRRYFKILSTYIEGFIPYIKEDSKIHTTFNQALTQTGRLSSSEPNLQNISIKDEDAKLIRKAFFFKENNLNLLSFDYSQIELRMLAHLSNSKTLQNVFNNDQDIHTETAKKIFDLGDNEPTPLQRRNAKAVNFGIVYGISDWGLSEQIQVPVKEAKEIIASFYDKYPEIKIYLNSLVEFAQKEGYVSTLFNRRRYLPQINGDSFHEREFAKRAATNAPIQGSAADLIKIIMINIHKALKENNLKAKLINQVHDEVILKVDDSELDTVYNLVKDIMENSIKLDVKLKVDGGFAKTWFDAK